VPEIIEFYEEKELLTQTFKDKCWIVPTKVNHGCFDAIQILFSSQTLRVVQCTIASKHDFKLEFVLKILEVMSTVGIQISSMDLVVVVPSGYEKKFTTANMFSDKCKQIQALKWKPDDLRTLGFSRSGV